MTTMSFLIAKTLNLNYEEFNLELVKPEGATTKIGGSEKGRNKGLSGGATTMGRRFITNGVIEKIIDTERGIPEGFHLGRVRISQPKKPITIDGVEYPSNKEAAAALNVTPGMVTYYRKRQARGITEWKKLNWSKK